MLKTPDIDYDHVGLLLSILKETHGYPKYIKLRTAAERELQNIEDECSEEMDEILAEERAALTTPVVPGLPVSGMGAPILSSEQGGVPVGQRILSPGTSDVGAPASTQGKLAFDGTPETTPESGSIPPNSATTPAAAGTPATVDDMPPPPPPSMLKGPDVAQAPEETPVVTRRTP